MDRLFEVLIRGLWRFHICLGIVWLLFHKQLGLKQSPAGSDILSSFWQINNLFLRLCSCFQIVCRDPHCFSHQTLMQLPAASSYFIVYMLSPFHYCFRECLLKELWLHQVPLACPLQCWWTADDYKSQWSHDRMCRRKQRRRCVFDTYVLYCHLSMRGRIEGVYCLFLGRFWERQ